MLDTHQPQNEIRELGGDKWKNMVENWREPKTIRTIARIRSDGLGSYSKGGTIRALNLPIGYILL